MFKIRFSVSILISLRESPGFYVLNPGMQYKFCRDFLLPLQQNLSKFILNKMLLGKLQFTYYIPEAYLMHLTISLLISKLFCADTLHNAIRLVH